jgi:hypothetical protein
MDQELIFGLGLFIAFMAVHSVAIWAVLAFVPSLSLAATVSMTPRLWAYTATGFLWGMFLGSSLADMLLGARPLAYGRWDFRRYREPKTALGRLLLLAAASLVGIFFANSALGYGLKHP